MMYAIVLLREYIDFPLEVNTYNTCIDNFKDCHLDFSLPCCDPKDVEYVLIPSSGNVLKFYKSVCLR